MNSRARKTNKSFDIKALAFYSALISSRRGTKVYNVVNATKERRGLPTAQSNSSLFNSVFTRTTYHRILHGIHTACPHMTPSIETFMALLHHHGLRVYSIYYTYICMLYSSLFIRHSFNCSISSPYTYVITVCRTNYLQPNPKVRITIEANANNCRHDV